jgi:hypothetical protein
LEDAAIVTLYENEETSWGEVRRKEKPRKPITHILEPSGKDALYLFAFDEVFRAGGGLSRFRLAYKLGLGSGFATAVDRLANGGLLVATPGDGLWRLDGGRSVPHAFAGDLGARRIDRIERASDGLVFFGDERVWQQSAGDWATQELVPPVEPRFAIAELRGYAGWQPELAFVDTDGAIVSVSRTNLSPGPRATVRFRGDSPTLLAVENEHEGYLNGGFATPDGELWATSWRGLYRLSKTGWKHAAALSIEGDAGAARVKALATRGPPWYLLEQESGELFELGYEGPRTRVRAVVDGGARLFDAVRWRGAWLFATSAGLRRYDVARRAWANVRLAVDASRVRVLARDDAGRLWLAGDGLWVVVDDRVVDLSALPPLAGADVLAMAADPHRLEGVVMSLGERGLLYVATE